jgi:hypothetical protein
MQKKLKCGTLRKRPDGISELAIVGNHNVSAVLKKLEPFLIIKKKQCVLLLDIIKQLSQFQSAHDFLKVCNLVDNFLLLNNSKKRIITSKIVSSELAGLNLFPVETEGKKPEI